MSFTFEHLESRVLLAASVVQKGTTLYISGDASNDAIRIDGTGLAPGDVEVFHDSDGDGTVDTSLGVFHCFDNISIKIKGGNNAIGIDDIAIAGNLSVKTGSGNDCVFLFQSSIGGSVKFSLGSGTNDLGGLENEIMGNATFKTGGGIDDFEMSDSVVHGKFNVNLGGGNDSLALRDNDFGVGSKVNGGGGQDLFIHYGQPMPANVTFAGIETPQDAYPSELASQLVARHIACYNRLGGQGVLNLD
ncbi:MAG: hypothetical protein R3C01_00055 [Planctomycetaceae bacterium]